jgi:hypothetical protein
MQWLRQSVSISPSLSLKNGRRVMVGIGAKSITAGNLTFTAAAGAISAVERRPHISSSPTKASLNCFR